MRIGIDLGGTKISGILMAPDGSIQSRARIASPRGNYQATLHAIEVVVDRLAGSRYPDAPVGIGIPGTISPGTGLIKNANSTWLIGKPFDRDVEAGLKRPTRIANDADCFALSEASDGAGQGHNTVFGVILGTGVGGGLVVNRALISGPNAIAGEWGHNPLPWLHHNDDPALPCYCGKNGCIETYLSGPGLSAHHKISFGESQTAVAIAASDTEDRRQSIDLYTRRLAKALSHVINIFDPEVIVLGGGLSEIDALYDAVPKHWGDYVFSDSVVTSLLRNEHGADSGVRGAAWLWPAQR